VADRFEEIYEKLMKVLKGKQLPQSEGNDKLDEIIRNLKELAYKPFHQRLLEEIRNAIYSKGPYAEKFPIKVALSKRGVSVLVNILKKDKDDFVVDEYSPYTAVYYKRRTVLLLPTAIVGVDTDIQMLMPSLIKWERKIAKKVERRFGRFISDKAFGYGEVFFASKIGSTIYEIIDDVIRGKWRKVQLFEINAIVKTDGKDSIVIIPPEEVTEYMLHRIGIKIERKTRKIPFSQKVEEMLRPYKEVIEAAKKYKPSAENDVIIFKSTIKNPQVLSYHIIKFVAKKMGKDPRNVDLEWEYGYRIAKVQDIYVTVMPKRLVITKFKPNLFEAMARLSEVIKRKFGSKDYFDSPRSGRVYFTPSSAEERVEIDIDVFGEKLKARIKDNTLWIPRSSMIKFAIEATKAQARGKNPS